MLAIVVMDHEAFGWLIHSRVEVTELSTNKQRCMHYGAEVTESSTNKQHHHHTPITADSAEDNTKKHLQTLAEARAYAQTHSPMPNPDLCFAGTCAHGLQFAYNH
jgi:hypothetical protein